jgi:hypothetical protein
MFPATIIQKIVNGLLYKTEWYKSFFLDIDHEIYPDKTWCRNHDERNFDVVNLGSSGGKWAFDYSDIDIKAMNWAQQPQTLVEDYNLLRCFHSILRKGGCVLITIMPFTSINKKTGLFDAMKYLKIDTQGEPIEPNMHLEALRYVNNPLLFGKKKAIKTIIQHLRGREVRIDKIGNAYLDYNPMSEEQLKQDAKMWMEGWKRQFSISDFEAPLTSQNQLGRKYRIRIMRELIDFCLIRGYKPIYVIPPVTEFLEEKFTPRFREIYIYDYLRDIERDVLLLDYSDEKELMAPEMYFNSFFLNVKGRKSFTKRVLKDIGLIE